LLDHRAAHSSRPFARSLDRGGDGPSFKLSQSLNRGGSENTSLNYRSFFDPSSAFSVHRGQDTKSFTVSSAASSSAHSHQWVQSALGLLERPRSYAAPEMRLAAADVAAADSRQSLLVTTVLQALQQHASAKPTVQQDNRAVGPFRSAYTGSQRGRLSSRSSWSHAAEGDSDLLAKHAAVLQWLLHVASSQALHSEVVAIAEVKTTNHNTAQIASYCC
jgi:hypothetical protein